MGADCEGPNNKALRSLIMWAFKTLIVAVIGAAFTLGGLAYAKAVEAEKAVACNDRDLAHIRAALQRIELKLDNLERR